MKRIFVAVLLVSSLTPLLVRAQSGTATSELTDPAALAIQRWVVKNSSVKPEPLEKKLAEYIAEGRNYSIAVGKALTKDKKHIIAYGWNGDFFTSSLTNEQARRYELNDSGVRYATEGRRQTNVLREESVKIDRLNLSDASRLENEKKLHGTLTTKSLSSLPATTALRLVLNTRGPTISYYVPFKNLTRSGDVLTFDVGPITDVEEQDQVQPVAVFVDLLEAMTKGDEKARVISNTLFALATFANVEQPTAAATSAPSIPAPSAIQPARPVGASSSTGSPSATSGKGYWIDEDTALMWSTKDNGADIDWRRAGEYCRALTIGGFAGWRLPTIEELSWIYDPRSQKRHKTRGPIEMSEAWAWSSSKDGSMSAWFLDLSGAQRVSLPVGVSVDVRALCVRPAATAPIASVPSVSPLSVSTPSVSTPSVSTPSVSTPFASATPSTQSDERGHWTDTATKLMWTVKDNGYELEWEAASEYCEALTLGGYRGWRLPTIQELERIFDKGATKQHKTRGPIEISDRYAWSSLKYSSRAGERESGARYHLFSFSSGRPFLPPPSPKPTTALTLCVRKSG